MCRTLFFVLFLLKFNQLSAQLIEGSFRQLGQFREKIILKIQKGNALHNLDSATIIDGKFVFENKFREKGYYWLWLNDSNKVDFIINPNEPRVKFLFNSKFLFDSLEVVESLENKLLWESKKISRLYSLRIEKELRFRNALSSNDSKLKNISIQNQKSLEAEREKKIRDLINQNPHTFFSQSSRYFIELAKIYENKTEGRRILISALPLEDKAYLNTGLYPMAIMNILQNHTNFDETGFKKSVDTLLLVAKPFPKVYDFFLSYLTDIFYQVGPDVILDYLVENYYLRDGCYEGSSQQIIQLIKQYENIQIGSKCPEFVLFGKSEEVIDIYEIILKNHKPVVLFYYSSHCPFCHQIINEIKNRKEVADTFLFVFISVDTQRDDWINFEKELPTGSLNFCDFKGWNSPAVQSLKIHKTPSIIRLGKDGTILSKDHDLSGLMNN